jgi:hypothetical protein
MGLGMGQIIIVEEVNKVWLLQEDFKWEMGKK